jgi:hypothetical protein
MEIQLLSFRMTLKIVDDKGQLGIVVVTHMRQRIPRFLKDFMTRLKALYAKDMVFDNSDRVGYKFVAVHYHWYNRFAELVCSINCNLIRYLVTLSAGNRCSSWSTS